MEIFTISAPPPERAQYGQNNKYGESINETINTTHLAICSTAFRALSANALQGPPSGDAFASKRYQYLQKNGHHLGNE